MMIVATARIHAATIAQPGRTVRLLGPFVRPHARAVARSVALGINDRWSEEASSSPPKGL